MKLKILAVSLAAFFVISTTASAGYYIPPLKAKRIAREASQSFCEEEAECLRYGWGCEPAGRGALCILTSFYEGVYAEIECEEALHLTVGVGGYIRKSFGKVHCFSLE
jgi:hypothetical protein